MWGSKFTPSLNIPGDVADIPEEREITIDYRCALRRVNLAVGRLDLYDPSGLITDAKTGQPISNTIVSLYRLVNAQPDTAGQSNDCRTVDTRPSGDGVFGPWSSLPSADVTAGILINPQVDLLNGSPMISPTINSQITGIDGYYGWDVAEGCWFIIAEADGYGNRVSPAVGVPPAVTDLHVTLAQEQLIYLPLMLK